MIKNCVDGRTVPGVCGNGSVPLSHSGNVVTRIGSHTHDKELLSIKVYPHVKASGQPGFLFEKWKYYVYSDSSDDW